MELVTLPQEILSNILLRINDLQSYIGINEQLDIAIARIFKQFEDIYSSLVPNWKNNYTHLLDILIKDRKMKSLDFFLNNYTYDQQDVLNSIAKYGTVQMLEDFINEYYVENIDYMKIALEAAKTGNLSIIKWVSKFSKINYYEILEEGIKYDQVNTVQYAMLRTAINLDQVKSMAKEYNSKKILSM